MTSGAKWPSGLEIFSAEKLVDGLETGACSWMDGEVTTDEQLAVKELCKVRAHANF